MLKPIIASATFVVLNLQSFGQTARTTEPEDLTRLRASWQLATQQAVTPLNKKYVDALEAMKLRFTKEGKLEAALAVDAELKGIRPQQTPSSVSPTSKEAPTGVTRVTLSDSLPGSTWIPAKSEKWLKGFTFIDDHQLKMEEQGGSTGIYEYSIDSKDTVKFKFSSGTINTLQFDKKAMKMSYIEKKIEFSRQ